MVSSPSSWKEVGFAVTTLLSSDCFFELLFLELETKSVTSQGLSFGLKIGILDILPLVEGSVKGFLPQCSKKDLGIFCHIGNVFMFW
jgi:hypothetical protein